MKKTLLFVAVATLFAFSCQKENENEPSQQQEAFTFTASIENLTNPTKADIDASYDLIWRTGDQIGIYVNGWAEDSHQQFDLVGDGGSSVGSFVRNQAGGWFKTTDAIVAYFPYGGGNNYSAGNLYITLPEHFGTDVAPAYTSGKMLTPLVAPVVYSGTEWVYNPIEFKHAGAAIKVTINNLPAGAHSISLSADQPVWGYYHISPAVAGTVDMEENSPGVNDSNTTSWLHFASANISREFVFIFPVPAMTTPDLTFSIYDENDILVWRGTASNQLSINHGDILVMPARTITPYKQFNAVSDTWMVQGNMTDNSWSSDVPVITDGTKFIAKGLSFPANGEFKIKHPGSSWDESWPDGNYKINNDAAGTYDIVFTNSEVLKVTLSRSPYPDASGFGKGSDISSSPNVLTGDFEDYFN